MNEFLRKFFGTETGSISIDLFSIWHFLYLAVIFGIVITFSILLKKKSDKTKNNTLIALAYAIVIVFVADFFIQPFYSGSGEMIVSKLPFHFCTILALIIPFVQFNKKFLNIKETIAVLAVTSSLMYMLYPGTALGGVTPWCYKVIQTFLYHGLVLAWGCFTLATSQNKLKFKNIWKEFVAVLLIVLWAAIGNAIYSTPDRTYDFFFLSGNAFSFIPKWLMPIAVVAAVYAVIALVYGVAIAIRKIANRKSTKHATPASTTK